MQSRHLRRRLRIKRLWALAIGMRAWISFATEVQSGCLLQVCMDVFCLLKNELSWSVCIFTEMIASEALLQTRHDHYATICTPVIQLANSMLRV
jgi:hypothetical protein